jgi:hypothetical protein
MRHVDTSATGGKAGPKLFVLLAWNWVSPYFRPQNCVGKPIARKAAGNAGKGWWKKRTPGCNGLDGV